MKTFAITKEEIPPVPPNDSSHEAGAVVIFEGRVRIRNEGREVRALEYDATISLAEKEGERIMMEAIERFGLLHAYCLHRVGKLELGELAVRVVVSAAHRKEAFEGCQFIMDEIKARVPIWKKEHYTSGDSGWLH